jgi:hypothetical protein
MSEIDEVLIERITAEEGAIRVYSPSGDLWYVVTTINTVNKDFSWMLKNKPKTLPFTVTDSNLNNFRELATK